MKSLFEEMGGTYRQEGDYLIPNLALPDEPEYQIGPLAADPLHYNPSAEADDYHPVPAVHR